MKYVDVHCHLDKQFFPNIEPLTESMKNTGTIALPAGITPTTNRRALKLAAQFPDLFFPTLGIYPPDALKKETDTNEYHVDWDYNIDEEITFIKSQQNCIYGIGEVGMDFKDGTDQKNQEVIFRKMIELAISLDKPLIIHSRKAEQEVINILETYSYKKIVMHCFCGKNAQVKRVRANGWYFSIPCNIHKDEHFQRIVKETPLYQLLTETDSPFLGPTPGEQNTPVNVAHTINHIAKLKNLPDVDVKNLIWRNTTHLFKITSS